MTKTFASLLFLTVVTTGCENSRSKLDDMAPAKLPKALQIDSVAAASADHSGTTEDRLARIENTLAKYREPLEFLSKVYEQQQQQADQEARREHAPDAMFAVPVAGDLEVGMVEGPSTAYVTIVKAFDFACPYCMKVNDTMHELVKDYGGKVRVVYKNLVVHPETATMGHLASCAAAKQHKYLEFKDAFWTNAFTPYAQSRGADADKMGKDHILAFSKDLGLDTAKMAADMDSDDCRMLLKHDSEELEAFQVGSTPTFFINGKHVSGALPTEAFKTLIDEQLKIAEQSGVGAADYYDKVVIAKGEKKFRSKLDPKPQ